MIEVGRPEKSLRCARISDYGSCTVLYAAVLTTHTQRDTRNDDGLNDPAQLAVACCALRASLWLALEPNWQPNTPCSAIKDPEH